MESLKLSFESIMPLFILMALGYAIREMKLADKKDFDVMNKLVFTVFLPTLLFYNIYKTGAATNFDLQLAGFAVIGILTVFAVGYFVVKVLSRDNSKRGVMLQGFFRSNYAILGVPLVEYICGGNSTGLASLMVAVIIPVFNVLAVISLETFRGGKVSFKELIKGIITNPLIIASLLGVLFMLCNITLPTVIEKAVSDISKIASPLAIIILGASFSFSSIKGYVRDITIVVLTRLIIVPLLAVVAAVLLGFTGEALACLLIAFGAPVAVSSYSMSQQMGGDETLSAQVVVISSALCLATLFMWIFILSYMGLF